MAITYVLPPQLIDLEALSGVEAPAVVELAPGKPLLPLLALHRLLRRQDLAMALARALVLEEIDALVALPEEEENQLIGQQLESLGIRGEESLSQWLKAQGLSKEDIRCRFTQRRRLELYAKNRFGDEVEVRYLDRKIMLDQVEYSLIRSKDGSLAEELYQQIREGEAEFSQLASAYSEGPERNNAGRIGPVPLGAGHPDLVKRLRSCDPGQLLPPFAVGDTWLVLRVDRLIPAPLTDDLRQRLLGDLLQEFINNRATEFLQGEAPTPLVDLSA
jgi:parvulin-like peptidyl-prolyl isomerase